MAIAFTQATACAECERLKLSRECDPPHEYLVLRRPGARAIYQCLVCHTNLAIDLQDAGEQRWVVLTDPPERVEGRPAPPSGASQPHAR